MVLPVGGAEGQIFSLETGAVRLTTEGAELGSWPVPTGSGRPVDSCVEPRRSTGMLAYERAVGFVDLAAFEPAPVFVTAPEFVVRRVSINDTWAMAVGDEGLVLYGQEGGEWSRRWSAQRPSPLASLQFAVADNEAEYVAVGEALNGVPRLVRMNREQGSWVVANEQPIAGMTRVDAARSIGSGLLLFGVKETADRTIGFTERIEPKDVELRARKFDLVRLVPYDLDTIRVDGVEEVAITGCALSPDRVVLVMNGVKVLAYRNTDGSDWLQPIKQTRYSSTVQVSWVGGNRFRLTGADRTWIETFE